MSVRTTPPFRADHVGSLLRPRALLQAREDAARGAISLDDLRAIEDAAIRDAVAMQADIGLRSVTDGEFRRTSWHLDFIYEIAGNFRSSWVAQGGYDFVADALFNELTVDGYFMEFDDERSGGFAPLRFVPKGKYVVLGLVTSKKGELEAKDDLKRRIEEASKFVDIDQLCLSPQCGFSSTMEGNSLSRDQQIAKLRLVAETAEEVWGTP